MAFLTITRVKALPQDTQANNMYIVAGAEPDDSATIYITGNNAKDVRRVMNAQDVQTAVTKEVANQITSLAVGDMAALELLTPKQATVVYVADKSTQNNPQAGGGWFSWNPITSTFAEISTAGTASGHTHDNKSVLDKFSYAPENGLMFDGKQITFSGPNEW